MHTIDSLRALARIAGLRARAGVLASHSWARVARVSAPTVLLRSARSRRDGSGVACERAFWVAFQGGAQ